MTGVVHLLVLNTCIDSWPNWAMMLVNISDHFISVWPVRSIYLYMIHPISNNVQPKLDWTEPGRMWWKSKMVKLYFPHFHGFRPSGLLPLLVIYMCNLDRFHSLAMKNSSTTISLGYPVGACLWQCSCWVLLQFDEQCHSAHNKSANQIPSYSTHTSPLYHVGPQDIYSIVQQVVMLTHTHT